MQTPDRWALVFFLVAGLPACESMNPQQQHAAAGAVIGGAAGALITGGSPLGTVGGAAVGGAVGSMKK